MSLILRSNYVVTPGGIRPASIHVSEGIITKVGGPDDGDPSETLDVGDAVVLPGLVDTHVHVNEPGRTFWEGAATATKAAAAGGITTLVDMPLNCIPATTTVDALKEKIKAVMDQTHVDFGFWGGVVPENQADLEPLWNYGVLGFKCFMVPSGVTEFAHVNEGDLRAAMTTLARLGATLMAHAESPAIIDAAAQLLALNAGEFTSYARYMASRPDQAEVEAIRMLLRVAKATGARVHVVHLATTDAVGILAEARAAGVPVTVETCPHYLHFASETIPDGDTSYKCAPPIRNAANREGLWKALADGIIDMVVSDHSPAPLELKCYESGDLVHGWGGIASLQVSLPAVWTGAEARGFGVEDIARWMSQRPAQLAGIGTYKGAIVEGYDADLVVFNPDASFEVKPAALKHRHPLTPYAGHTLRGVVQSTFLRGTRIYHWGLFEGDPMGNLLRRPGAG